MAAETVHFFGDGKGVRAIKMTDLTAFDIDQSLRYWGA